MDDPGPCGWTQCHPSSLQEAETGGISHRRQKANLTTKAGDWDDVKRGPEPRNVAPPEAGKGKVLP